MMLTHSRRPPTPEELATFETMLGRPLPPRYREFIHQHNGGIPAKPMYTSPNGNGVYFQAMFRIGNLPRSLAEEIQCLSLPLGLIPIGLLGCGGALCLDPRNDAIFIWEYENSDENGNILPECVERVEDDIYQFFEKLESGESEEDKAEDEKPDEISDMATWGDIHRLEEFVRVGGDLSSVRTNYGKSILQAAVLDEDFEFMEACLRLGAPIDGALHEASEWNKPDAIEWLLRKGANINELDGQGRTPLDLATIGIAALYSGAKLIIEQNGGRTAVELGKKPDQ